MARNITVYFADGSQHVYQNVPDEVTPDQVLARAGRDFSDKQVQHLDRSAAPEAETTLGGYAKEAVKGLVPGLVGLGETAITGAAALLPEEQEQAVREAVAGVAQPVREYFAPAAGYEDATVRKLSEAVGSTLPFLPLGALGLAGRAAAAGLGVAAGAGEARQRAEQAQATEGERAAATALGTIPGALESLPPVRILRRFGFGDEAIAEVAGLVPALTRVAKAGGEEALQEASSQVLQNLIAKGTYQPDEAIFGGVGEAAAMGGGAGAVVSAIAELALGRRLRGAQPEPTTEAPPVPEEVEPEITAEALAPKEGRPARAAPIRAKTLEELRGELPAAPVVAAEEVAAPREPVQFEQTKEPTPEALQEAAAFVEQFPEGGKQFNLFKAKAIARKLGYENIPQKGVGRVDIEPLIRRAITPRETVAPAEDVVVGQNAAGERLYERQDGSRYRMRFDRADRPAGYPDFGGDLAPVEAPPVPIPAVEAVAPTVAPEVTAPALPEIEVPEVAKLASQIADIVAPPRMALPEVPTPRPITVTAPEVARVEAPRMEVPSELPRTGIEQAVVGTTPRGIEMPLPRPVAAGPRVERAELPRLAAVEPVIERAAERAEVVPPALEPETSKPTAVKIPKALHGSPVKGLTSLSPHKAMEVRGTTWFTDNPDVADQYIYPREYGEILYDEEPGQVYSAELNMDNPLVVDYKGKVGDAVSLSKLVEQAKSAGHDGLIVKNVDDSIDSSGVLGTSYAVFKPDQINLTAQEQAPPQIFESIDVLNRPLPPVTEQLARERAPSLRRELSKAVKQFDADKMSGAELANRASMLLLQTQKERMVQPRQRGAEFVRERLMNASRRGEIDPDGVELASWFIQQNPLLVDDLGISIRKRPEAMEGTAAFYNPANRVVTLFKDAGDPQTATHEILHHTERLMPVNIRAGILEAYVKQLTKAEKKAKSPEEKAALKTLLEHHLSESKPSNYDSVMASLKDGALPKSLYQYVNPSEFWAVNGARIVQGRYDVPPGVVAQIKKWLREFIEKAKSVFGMTSDAPIIRALDSLAKADGKYRTDEMLAQAPAYMAIEPTEKPKAMKPKKTVAELRREASEKLIKPGVVRQAINKLVGPEVTFETLAKNYQNQRRKLKKIQDDLRLTGRLETVGEDKNDAENSISTAANRASYIVQTEVEPVAKRLREAINAYAESIKATTKDALEKIDGYLIALHEPERRETKYLRNVPLDNTTKMEFLPGEPAMTAADARAALESRRSLAKNTAQAEAIQDMMRYLAANYADPRGYSPVKAKLQDAGKPTPEEMTTDFYDDIYSVIGPEYTQEDLEATREEYEGLSAAQKKLVDQVRQDLNALHELNKSLNRRANYWTDKVDRVVESYGWKNYVPFKGSPRADKTLDTDTEYLSGELSQAPESFEGRRTNFDSPVLQTIAESYFAASRAGRGTDVTQTIKNLIKLGVIKTKTKKPKVFTFEERNSPDFDYNEVRGADKVLHYNEDGSVEVYRIQDPEMLEAIKTTYRDMSWATKMGNAITSTLGQFHTRFNPAFPPMDFIRNSITNAGLISAREGGKAAREYLSAVATNVARNGLWKAGKLSKLLSENNTAELNRLYNTGHPFYRDAMDMMKYGGRTMYRMSFNIKDTMEGLQKEVGPKKILADENAFLRYIDAYNDAFELTSRVGAYSVRKQQNIAEAKKKGLNVNDRKVMEDIEKEAAAFALSLMDFRKIGKYGKELGAYFMFIRPAATGAVDAIDALRPGFQTREKAFDRLEPEVKELFETQTLAKEVEKLEAAKRPNKKKIEELKKEIARREKSSDEFEGRRLTRAKTARNTALFTVALGAAIYGMAAAISGDDDEGRNRVTTDDMSRWTRYARLPIIGDEGFFQIPWGFGVTALMSAGAQTAALANGSSSFKDYAGNMVEIGIDSFLPIPASRINPADNFGAWLLDSATPSAARPLVEFVLNVDAMGNPIYNSRAGKYADAFSGSSRPSELHRKISEFVFNMTDGEVSFSPDSVAFFLNNYADAPNHLAENSWNMFLTATGDKEFDAKKDTIILRSFIGRNSNYDARKFAEAEKEIQGLARKIKTFEDFGTPEQVARFYKKNPNADILIDVYNASVNGELRRLRQERNQILRDRTLTPKQRDLYLDDIRTNENYLKKLLVEDFEAYKGN